MEKDISVFNHLGNIQPINLSWYGHLRTYSILTILQKVVLSKGISHHCLHICPSTTLLKLFLKEERYHPTSFVQRDSFVTTITLQGKGKLKGKI